MRSSAPHLTVVRRLDVDRQLLAHGRLAEIFVELFRPDRRFERAVFAADRRGDDAGFGHAVIMTGLRAKGLGLKSAGMTFAKVHFSSEERVFLF